MPPSRSDSAPDAPPFDVRQLRILIMLDEEGSLSGAARRLHLTQSAVSHALRRLEDDAEVRLVERNARGAALTQAGQSLARHAEAVLQRMRVARDELLRLRDWGGEVLRLAAGATACQYLLPPVLYAFREKHPKCRVQVTSGEASQRLSALRDGQVDLAIIAHSGLEVPDVEFIELFSEALCLVYPRGVAQSKRSVQPWIAYRQDSSLTEDARRVFERSGGPPPRPLMELESLEAIKSVVKLGSGCAVLPEWFVQDEVRSGELGMETPPADGVRRHWAMAHRRGRRLSMAETTWVQLCRDHGLRMARTGV